MSAHTTLRIQFCRVGWLLLIWAASVLALGIVASLFRGLMTLAGLTV
jgi:uncharacterized protein DUF2474